MMVVALTGGIGCGKSAVSRQFEDLGIPVADADVLARRLVQPGTPALEETRSSFGESVINDEGHLNRSVLRQIIFDDPNKKNNLKVSCTHALEKQCRCGSQIKAARMSFLLFPCYLRQTRKTSPIESY